MPFRTALRAPRAATNLARRLTTSRRIRAGASRSFSEPLEDRRLLSVNILAPVQHAAEGNRVGFFADYTAGQRPASTRVWWGDGAIEDLMLDYNAGSNSGTVYGLHDYASPGVYSVTFSVTGGSGSSDTETFFTDNPGAGDSLTAAPASYDGAVSDAAQSESLAAEAATSSPAAVRGLPTSRTSSPPTQSAMRPTATQFPMQAN